MTTQTDQSNRYAPPQAVVADSDDGDGEQLASRGSRLGAILLDGLVWMLLVYAPLMIGAWGSITQAVLDNPNPANRAQTAFRVYGAAFSGVSATVGLFALAGFIVCVALNIYFVKRNGQSIGKKLLGIKVVRKDGSPASLGRIFWLRNVVNALPNFIPFLGTIYGLADSLFIFAESRQCLHDRIAGTRVIKA